MNPIEIISLEFLILTVVTASVYYILSPRAQIIWLLGVSYFFYVTWSVWYVTVLLVFTTLNYLLAKQIERSRSRTLLLAGILINAGSLVSLKFLTGPYGANLIEQTGTSTLTGILLPIGFSFYVLQAISYLIDVYRSQVEAEKDFLQFALYLAYFPKMLAGPIEPAKNFLPQLKRERIVDREGIEEGIYLILLGLLRKVVIANHLSNLLPAEIFSTPEEFSSLERGVWLLVFAFILYNDFAGYTSIVRGISFLLGIRLSPNFRQPFLARSFSDFWARWHITLSEWLRDYVFYPVRRGLMQARGSHWMALVLPSMLTMLISGFWHGASLALLFWGFLHGVYLVLEQVLLQFRVLPAAGRKATFYSALVFILVTLAWIPFNTPSLRATGRYLSGFLPLYSASFEVLVLPDLFLLIFFSLWIDWQEQYHGDLAFPRKWSVARQSWSVAAWIVLLVLFSSTGIDLSRFVYEFF
jgi:D-alanyl-lipoteichoic acid acyltransferase DltB (MBOAT superfamily)